MTTSDRERLRRLAYNAVSACPVEGLEFVSERQIVADAVVAALAAEFDAAHARGVAEGRARASAFIANEIRAELVCCDIYDRMAPLRAKMEASQDGGIEASGELDDAVGSHDICYWGEAAARIAEGRNDESQVGPWEPAEQAESPDSPAVKMRSLRAHPHGSACICDDCTSRDEAAHMAAMEGRHQHEAEQFVPAEGGDHGDR